MATLTSSDALSALPRLIGLIGTQGRGKTNCAVTISETFPDCKDTVLLAFDLDATVGLRARGINVPTFELSGINDWPIMQKEIEDIVKQLIPRIKDKITLNIIIDTVSMFDNSLLSYFQSRTPDNFALYGAVGKWHRWFLMEQLMPLTALGARIISVFQPIYKEVNAEDKKAAEKKAIFQARNTSEGLEPEADKLLGVSGKIAAKLYRTQCSGIWPVERTKEPTGQKFWIYTDGGGLGFEYKNRFPYLAPKEPADLKAIYRKIAQHKAVA